MKTRKTRKGMHEKICNICGEKCFVYIVWKNAPLCKDCMPVKEYKELKKKIPSEATMIESLLRFSN